MNCGRKEFQNKAEALRALEFSKSRVSEMMSQARTSHLNEFKKSVGKTIKEDHNVAIMPKIRISAAKKDKRNHTFIGTSKRNFFPGGAGGEAQNKTDGMLVGGLTPINLSKIGNGA